MQRRILVTEGSFEICQQFQQLLEPHSEIEVDTVSTSEEALAALKEHNYSIFITELRAPHLDGMHLIEEVQKRCIPVTVIVLAAHSSIDDAVQAMRLGAYDFLRLPIEPRHLHLVIKRILRERLLQDEVVDLRQQLENRYAFHN